MFALQNDTKRIIAKKTMASRTTIETQRSTIEFYHKQGYSRSQIFKTLRKHGVSKMMVYRTVKRLTETGSTNDRKRSGKPRTVRTPAMIKRVQARVARNPCRSQRKLAKDLKCSKTSIQTILVSDLGLKPYKKRKVHGLTSEQKKKRHQRSKQLLLQHAAEHMDQIVFSDEKFFTVEESFNPQNVRVYAASFQEIPEHMRTVQRFQAEQKIMVWAGISKEGKLPLVFIEPGVKVNAKYYLENILKKVVKPSCENIYGESPWIFQQDSAPAHKAKISQAWCRVNMPGFISVDE